jgi:two-component sensor histidine kinase
VQVDVEDLLDGISCTGRGPAFTRMARRLLHVWMDGCDEEQRHATVLAAHELVANSLEHGPPDSMVQLRITRLDDRRLVLVEVIDEGTGTEPLAPRDDRSPRGHGLRIAQSVAHEFGQSTEPRRVWFTTACHPPADRGTRGSRFVR